MLFLIIIAYLFPSFFLQLLECCSTKRKPILPLQSLRSSHNKAEEVKLAIIPELSTNNGRFYLYLHAAICTVCNSHATVDVFCSVFCQWGQSDPKHKSCAQFLNNRRVNILNSRFSNLPVYTFTSFQIVLGYS